MRAAIVVVAVAGAACGRIGFDASIDGNGGGDGVPIDGAGSAWSHLVAYANQTCAVLDGRAYCWGENTAGQLGIGSNANAAVPSPVLVPAGTVVAVTQGETHGCAIVDGEIYCMGTAVNSATPVHIGVPVGTSFTAISAGRDFTCAIANGVWCWGVNAVGQLGLGDTTPRDGPTKLALSPSYAQIRCGDDHACATGDAGPVCWGHNDNGTLGNGLDQTTQDASPTPVPVGGGVTALPLIAGWHACALEPSGDVLCWGRNIEGELGNNHATGDLPTPMPIYGNVSALATGGGPTDLDASCIVAVAGHAECWGVGLFGRLGNGDTGNQPAVVDVEGLPDAAAVELAVGYDHACAVEPDGSIWCWGRGDLGQLGDGMATSSLIPVEVKRP